MGLGGTRTSVLLPYRDDDLEWVDLAVYGPRTPRSSSARGARQPFGTKLPDRQPLTAKLPAPSDGTLGPAMIGWLRRHPLWVRGTGPRILLVDLDNLRAGPTRWQARMEVVVWLARLADHTILAGQHAAVARARPHLAELADSAYGVDDGSDLADHVLLDAAEAIEVPAARTVVISNDGIFVRLAGRGPLTVLSPGLEALSDKLRAAASRVVDLTAIEETALPAGR
jgi:hypothetical protein